MKESLRFRDELSIKEGILSFNGHSSARMVGEITIEEYDPLGNCVFSSKEYNDITIGGASFILEQMFKTASTKSRFNASGEISTGTPSANQYTNMDEYIKDEKIFGFVIGIGGEEGVSVKASSFTETGSRFQFIPFRTVKSASDLGDKADLYDMSGNSTINNSSYMAYYVKKFHNSDTLSNENPVDIVPEFADGSGEVTENNINVGDSPIYAYSKVIMEIDNEDVREYFRAKDGVISNCRINQIGLVAGKPIPSGNTVKYEDVRLVTVCNFKGRDLSNDENTLKMRYKIYCM